VTNGEYVPAIGGQQNNYGAAAGGAQQPNSFDSHNNQKSEIDAEAQVQMNTKNVTEWRPNSDSFNNQTY